MKPSSKKPLPPGTPTISLDEIERYNFPCVVLAAPVPGFYYVEGGRLDDRSPVVIPTGARLVDFHRDVAEIWRAKYGDPCPVNVNFPDGRFVSMTASVKELLDVVPEQDPVEWVTETQRYAVIR